MSTFFVVRLSVPGQYCVHCDAQLGQSVVCPGCKWVDPVTTNDPVKKEAAKQAARWME